MSSLPDVSEASGFICLHRKLRSNFLWQEKAVFSRREAWIDIIAFRARGIASATLKRGEFQVATTDLAEAWLWTKDRVRRFLDLLCREDMLALVSPPTPTKAAIYAVCNYEIYNGGIKTLASRGTAKPAKTPTKPEVATLSATPTATLSATLEPTPVVGLHPEVATLSATPTATLSATPFYKEEIKTKQRENKVGEEDNPGDEKTRREALRLFIPEEHERVRGFKPVMDKSDFVAVETMLAKTRGDPETFSLSRLMQYWQVYLRSPDPFDCRQGHPVRYFCSNITKFVLMSGNENGRAKTADADPNLRAAKDFVNRELAKTLCPDIPDVRQNTC